MNYYFKTQQVQIKQPNAMIILFKVICVRTMMNFEKKSIPWSIGNSMTARTMSQLLEKTTEETKDEFNLCKPNSILFFKTRQEARKFINDRLIPAALIKKLIEKF